MMRSGHKTESTFNRYNIGTETDLKEAAQKLENYRNGKQTEVEVVTSELQLFMLNLLLMAKGGTVTKQSQSAKTRNRNRIQKDG